MTQNQDAEVEVDLLLEHISKTKKQVLSMTKQFFENNINFETPFESETKTTLKDKMIEFLKTENQLKLQQQASTQLQYDAFDYSQTVSSSEDPIESIVEAANLNDKFTQIFEGLKTSNVYNPFEEGQFKNLAKLLNDDDNEDLNEDIEMVQTDFVIPNDPFSRMEIVNPVRNKNCNHLYDKEQFNKIFEARPRNSSIKCPYTGCANKKVTINDVEEDHRMKILIDNAKRQQE